MTLVFTLLGIALLLIPEASFANDITLPGGSGTANGGAGGLANYLAGWTSTFASSSLFTGFLALMLIIYAARMIFFAHSENEKTESKSAYVYAILGAIVVSVASVIAQAVSHSNGQTIIDSSKLTSPMNSILTIVAGLLYGALIANIAAQGMRMVSAHGDQGTIDKARKRLVGGFIGAVIVLLATAIKDAVWGKDMSPLTQELVGLAQFLLAFVGAGSVIAIIVGGFFLVISYDDSYKEKAKTAIKTGVISLIVVLLSYAFLSTIVNNVPDG